MTPPENENSKPTVTHGDNQSLDRLRKRYFRFWVIFELTVGTIYSLAFWWVGFFFFLFFFLLASLGIIFGPPNYPNITTFSERTCKLLTVIFVCGQAPFLFLLIFDLKLGYLSILDKTGTQIAVFFYLLTIMIFIVVGNSAKTLLKQRKEGEADKEQSSR